MLVKYDIICNILRKCEKAVSVLQITCAAKVQCVNRKIRKLLSIDISLLSEAAGEPFKVALKSASCFRLLPLLRMSPFGVFYYLCVYVHIYMHFVAANNMRVAPCEVAGLFSCLVFVVGTKHTHFSRAAALLNAALCILMWPQQR